jgi:hypothetical protein
MFSTLKRSDFDEATLTMRLIVVEVSTASRSILEVENDTSLKELKNLLHKQGKSFNAVCEALLINSRRTWSIPANSFPW